MHPTDGWLICTGGLLVAKAGYGVVKIANSRDQNSQHGFQWFIFSMLSTAWYRLTDFFQLPSASKSEPAFNRSEMLCERRRILTILRVFSRAGVE